MLGLNASMFKGYLRYIANRRHADRPRGCSSRTRKTRSVWMSEMIDLEEGTQIFETRVIEYQSGGALSWD